jgi:hypothetical protein
LGPWDTSKIKIFRNQAAFEANEQPVEDLESMTGLGDSRKNALIVLIPTTRNIYVKFSQNKPVPLKMHVENLMGQMVQKLFTAEDVIRKCVEEPYKSQLGLPDRLGPLNLYRHKDQADENEALRKIPGNYDLSKLAADEGTYERPLILKMAALNLHSRKGSFLTFSLSIYQSNSVMTL